jgi:hypothetical protein
VELKDKVQFALDEGRMLIMGIQVLLGFTFEAFLIRRFDALPWPAHELTLLSTAFLLIAVVLLVAPVARHRLVEHGEDTAALHSFAMRAAGAALLPFALALGIDFYLVILRTVGHAFAAFGGALAAVAALAAWYVLPFGVRSPRARKPGPEMQTPTKLDDKIKQVLIEVRVVLPGTQALLGFQFAGVLQDGFDSIPAASKDVYLAGLGFLGISVLLLMLPAAYHRIAEAGEISERLHRVSSRALLAAMSALALGIACDLYVVVQKTTGAVAAGVLAAAAWLFVSLATWLVYCARGRVLRVSDA